MLKKIKLASIIAVLATSTMASNVHAAQYCGTGVIVDLKEGGWNSDSLMIELSGPNASAGNTTKRGGKFVEFRSSRLSPEKLEAMRRMASMAFAMGARVWTNSHNGRCDDATELSILR